MMDLVTGKVLEFLEKNDAETLRSALECTSHRFNVKFVRYDFDSPFRNVVDQVLPEATPVIDHFHVQRLAQRALGNAIN